MDRSKLRVLVVEDHKLAQKMAVMAIEQLGCMVDTADTGAEAITQFKQHRYDFIFMDLGLPDMDGYTVTETIRGLEEKLHQHTPIVALTAHVEEEFRENAKRAGMDDFLSKPLTTDKAEAVLDQYVQPENISNIKRFK
ncbi:MAG: hypothetical protein COV52_09625 [Gammaproteobacteria bacterium CG11_big_fil_rev_8_21_14_0_20_46_22]|nr:MAG: hypothetical protein COV52_09625 [Gammaproteobacteria bacterium CG11_big_fil_rev_8_21_14_0_20_46_22]